MCGICGRYNFCKGDNVDLSEIKAMAERLHHRGPDEEGFYKYKNLGLGHKRLIIIDPEAGKQPMISFDKNFIIIFNGEIYNYFELRQELITKGYKFKTNSDTEVLLNLYIEYKEDCLIKINGMYAFTIFDQKEDMLFSARDRLGLKPFYYYYDKMKFIFASEIKAILAANIGKVEINNDALQDYFTFQFILGEKTFFKNIKTLKPGHYMIIKEQKMQIKKYWDIKYIIDTYHTEDYFVDKLLMLVEDSLRIRLRSDVPVGAHLSGGLDSSTVTVLAANLLSDSLKTFTGAFSEGKDYDETKYAKLVSEFGGTEYFQIKPTVNDFINYFEDIIYYMDEPTAGPGVFPQFFVSKLASKNVKVVLGGQGGDEIFGGYIRYLIAYFEQCIKGAIYQTNEEGNFVVDIKSIISNLPYIRNYEPLIKKFWSNGLFGPMSHRYFNLIQRIDDIKEIINPEVFSKDYNVFENYLQVFEKSESHSYFNKMTYFDLKAFLPSLLQVEDRTSMANSVESRLPLLDYRIIELLASIPPTIKYKGGEPKYIFKRAIRNLIPKEILHRKDKKGFPVPMHIWYQNDLKDYINRLLINGELVKREIINKNYMNNLLTKEQKYGRKIWGLLSLEVFFRNLKRMK